MALVYSYIRFSCKKQMEGDSFRRQVEAGEAWIKRNSHSSASLTLHDLGVSAFRGRNKHSGALRRFLNAIETGKIKPGSILLVENLDRLSRQGVDEAYDLFKSILKAGVQIAVLKPYEFTYTREALNDFIGLLMPLLYFHLAYIESKNKSDRLRSVWVQKRKEAATAGKRTNRRCPSWVRWDEDQGEFVLNDGAAAVKYIFEQTAQGVGQRVVLRKLQERYQPIGTSGRWNTSFIQKVLSDRAVLGEFHPCSFNDDGERIPQGEPIPNYYPAVIDEPLWYRAQAAKARNLRKKGPSEGFVNLFTGLLVNAHDGQPMHLQTSPLGKNKRQRRLVSYGHLSKEEGADPVSVPYQKFEEAVLTFLREVRIEKLHGQGVGHLLSEREKELAGVKDRLAEYQADLSNPEGRPLSTVRAAVEKLEDRLQTLTDEVEKLRAEDAARPLVQTQHVLLALREAPQCEAHALRFQVRSLIADVVDRIYLKPEKHYGRVYCLAQIFLKNGNHTHVEFGGPGRYRFGVFADGKPLGVDLRDRLAANSVRYFAEHARLWVESQEGTDAIPNDLPQMVGPASEVWLKVARAGMRKESFRVVPSKVRRFVAFVGPESRTRDVNAAAWGRWVGWLKGQIRKGKLARNTAKVNYSRSREFVRWLIANDLTADIPALRESSSAAL